MSHPDLSEWQAAKKATMAIAHAIGAEITQSKDGKMKCVKLNGRTHEFATWYAAYSHVYGIRLDELSVKKP